MDANFASVLEQLGRRGIMRLANAPLEQDADYLFERFLPTILRPDYQVTGGNIKIKGTLAPTIPMDTPFPEGGFIGMSDLKENTAKFGLSITLPEATLREIRKLLDQIELGRFDGSKVELLTNTTINFVQEMIVRPHDDQREWMRAQAITEGVIKQTSNRSEINVNYGIPAGNILAKRTGTAGYGRSASAWQSDYRTARRLLGQAVLATIMHQDTLDQILDNPANNLVVVGETYSPDRKTRVVQVRKAVTQGGIIVGYDLDSRNSYTLIGYSKFGNLPDLANPGNLIQVPFIRPGRIAVIGDAVRRNLLPQTENTPRDALGYTHVGPTEEGEGALGRWARVYTPEGRPMQLRGEGTENSLPAFDSPERVVLLDTELD